MRFKIIAVGAAGGKCAIDLIENNVVEKDDVLLINSTIKDIPLAYRDNAIRLSDTVQGCGQERALAKQICLEAIKSGRLNLDAVMDPVHDKAIIITSTCGGTGSGASVIIADYLKKIVDVEVEVIGLVGFEDESARSLRNLIEFCQDLEDNYSIQLIRNSAFLSSTRGNRSAAEVEANKEVVRRIKVMTGVMLRDSVQNIDNTDIVKLNNTTGYKTVEYKEITDKIRNVEQFNSILTDMLDNSAMIEPNASGVGRLGVIMNLQTTSQAFIDRSFEVLKERLGVPYEVYTHLEYCEDLPEFVAFIASGMKMPAKEIQNIYDKYTELSNAVNKNKDEFFSNIKELRGNENDAMFDSFDSVETAKKVDTSAAKDAFFKAYEN